MLGDTGVAVHPEDERYAALIKAGAKVKLPLVGREIPIVADEYSDPEKGTGAVKITPAHDFNDFEVGKRHDLAQINVLDAYGKINDEAPRSLSRSRPLRGAQEGRFRYRRAGPARKDRADRPHGSARRSLRRRHRAVADGPVVCQRRRAGEARDRRGRERQDRSSFRRTGRRPTSSGCATSSRGASRASSGGVIRSRRGTGRMARIFRCVHDGRRSASVLGGEATPLRYKHSAQGGAEIVALDSATKTCSTRGSRPRCGRSRRSAGRTRRRSSTATIRRACSSPASTSSSSGSPA